METVLGQWQEIEHLGSACEPNSPAFLFHSQSGDPYWDEAVLAEWQTEIGMSDDFKEELPILAAMNQLGRGRGGAGGYRKARRAGYDIRSLAGPVLAVLGQE